MLDSLIQNQTIQGNDFIDYCIQNRLCPADAGELLSEQLGIDGDEMLAILLK